MKNQITLSPAMDSLEISMLERELRAQAQVAAAKAVARSVRQFFTKVRHAMADRQTASALRSA